MSKKKPRKKRDEESGEVRNAENEESTSQVGVSDDKGKDKPKHGAKKLKRITRIVRLEDSLRRMA